MRVTCGAKRKRGVELALERGGVGDDGERADALLPGRELEVARRRIAAHDHVVDRRRRAGAEGVPDLEALQQVDRGGVERVGADVLARRRGRRAAQRHRETEARERQRQALADDPRAAHLHVEALHRGDCRERCGDNRRFGAAAAARSNEEIRHRHRPRRDARIDPRLPRQIVRRQRAARGPADRDRPRSRSPMAGRRPRRRVRDAARAAAHGARADDAEVERADPARARHARRARRHRSGRGAHRGRGLGRPRRRLRHGRPVRAVVQRFPRPPAPAGALRSRGAAPRRSQVDGCRRRRQCLPGRLPAPGRLGHVDRRSEPASRQRRPAAGHARPLPPEPRPRRPRCQRRGSSRRDRLRRGGGAGAAQARQAVRPLLDPRRRSRHRDRRPCGRRRAVPLPRRPAHGRRDHVRHERDRRRGHRLHADARE